MQAGAQTHCSPSTQRWGLQECPWGTATVRCPPLKSQQRSPGQFKDAVGLSRHPLALHPLLLGVAWAVQLHPSRDGACSGTPTRNGDMDRVLTSGR